MTKTDRVEEREKKYWDNVGDFKWATDESIFRILEHFPKNGGVVLELCCGSGMFTEHLAGRFEKYFALDISNALLDKLKSRVPSVETTKGDAQDPGFEDAFFDDVLIFGGLHHLPDLTKTYNNIHRILKPGGKIFCLEPNLQCWFRKPMLLMRETLGIYTEDERFLDPDAMEQDLLKIGFNAPKITFLTPKYEKRNLNFVNRTLAHCIYGASALNPGKFWQTFFILECVKK